MVTGLIGLRSGPPETVEQLQLEDKDDSKFWISYKDFLCVFDTIDFCHIFSHA